jgi:tetratricopeptide (TPR) repeat protein
LGFAHRQLGDYGRAIEWFELALTINRELDVQYWQAHALDQIGEVHNVLGARDDAIAAWAEAAAILERLHHPEGAVVWAKLNSSPLEEQSSAAAR